MIAKSEQIRIHYEFAMAIGTSLDMDTMLKKSLTTFMSKMNCLAGGVHFLSKNHGEWNFEPILSIPRKVHKISAYGAALEEITRQISSLPVGKDKEVLGSLNTLLPARGRFDDLFYSIVELPGLGIVVLLNTEQLDPLFLRSLGPVFSKLSVACNACLQNEELRNHQENLQKIVSEKTSELVSKNEHLLKEIEHRKEYEDALRRNEEKYRELVENANSIILRWDREGRITFFNEFAQTFFGFSEEEIIGRHVVGTIVPENESTGRDLRPLMDDICRNPQNHEYNVNENMRKDGTRVWIAWTNKILTDEKGIPVGALSIGADITGHRAAEQRFKLAAEAISDLIYEWDIRDDSLHWFGDIDSALGFEPGEFPHTLEAWIARIHPDDFSRLSNAVTFHRTSTEPINYEYRIQRKDGSWVYWSVYGVPVEDSTGKPSRWIGACTDITEKKKAEQELKESEERYRALFTNEIDAISIFEVETGRIIDVNDSWVKLYGYKREEMFGMTVRDVSAEPEVTQKAVKHSAATGTVFIPERHHRKKDGTEFIVELAAGPFTWKGQNLMYALVRDITERKRVENELRASENQMHLITDNSPAYIAYVGADDLRYRFVNRQFEESYNRPREEIIGQHIRDIIGEKNYEFALPYIEKVRTGQPVSYENVFPVTDGKRWIQVNYVPDVDEQGTVKGIVVLSHDITDLKRTQERLIQSEERFRSLYENMIEGVAMHELIYSEQGEPVDYRILGVNPMYEVHTGLASREAEGRTASELYGTGHPPFLDVYSEVVQTKKPVELEVFFEPLQKHFHISVFSHLPDQFVTVFVDITERRKADDKVKESEQLLAETQKLAQLGSWEFDVKTEEIRWSEETFRIAGREPKEKLMVQEYLDTVHPDDLPLLQDALERAANKREPYEVELRHKRPDGSYNYTLTRGKPVVKNNQIVKFIGSVLDITDRKRAEEELQRANEYLENVLQNSPDGIGIVDKHGKFVKWNTAAAELYGFSYEELAGKSFAEFYSNQQQLDAMLQMLRHDGYIRKYEIEMLQKDGTTLPSELSISLLKDENNVTIGSVCLARDLSETRKTLDELTKAYDELQMAKEAADAANKAKSAFLANMSHELRTPLNAILGFSELMKRDPTVSRGQLGNLETIGRSGEHLLSLINDVLEFSKIEAGQMAVNKEDFDLHCLLLGLEEMFRLRAEQKGLSLNLTMTEEVPQFVRTDQNKLRQILINLLGNAIKYTKQGSVTLSVTGSREAGEKLPGKSLLHFTVADTGVGISREEQQKIFDAFFQADGQRSSHQGTGLGLPISQKFVELLGGKLDVVSETGKGASFSFSVPVEPSEAADSKTCDSGGRVIGLAPGQPAFRLLVAEDNDNSRKLLTTLLRTVGFEVEEAVNGKDAVEKWREFKPHLIWMDMRMPVMDGYEATAKIKSEIENVDAGAGTKIIALTASAFEEDRKKVLEHGGDDFVRKPFRETELFEMMHMHLGARYVYAQEEKHHPYHRDTGNNITVLVSLLESLSATQRERLTTAAELSDAEMIQEIIEEISGLNRELAERLNILAENFAYDQILSVLNGAEKK